MRLLTHAPLPGWGDLFSALVKPSLPDRELAAPWCGREDEAFWFSRSAWSLAVIARWRQLQESGKSITVWVPDYFCNAALAPLRRASGVRIVFYPISMQLTPDIDACRDLAGTCSPDVVVLVHYFGQPAPAEPIANFCNEHGAWLVEDATHLLRPVTGVGDFGDCVLYSPYKHLAIPDGAVLVVRAGAHTRAASSGQTLRVLREASASMLDSSSRAFNCLTALWLIKRILQRFGLRSARKSVDFRETLSPAVSVTQNSRMSLLAKRLLSRQLHTIETVACLREQRRLDWGNVLLWSNAFRSVSPIVSKTTPYLAGYSCSQEADACATFGQLQQARLPVTTWPDLPPEVIASPETHETAIMLRHTRFYLPIHQSMRQSDVLAQGKRLLVVVAQQLQVRTLDKVEWDSYWRRCHQANLLQSWEYGAAKEKAEGWKAYRFMVCDEATHFVALAQILVREIPLVGGVARLNRGPLLLDDASLDSSAYNRLISMGALLREARRRRWWLMQAAPELPPTNEVKQGLAWLGFKKLPVSAWGSARLALHTNERELLMSLNGKWRNSMRKGEKMGVVASHHEADCPEIEMLVRSYQELQDNRRFVGLSEKLIRALAVQHGDGWQFSLFIARVSGAVPTDEHLGVLVTIKSGNTAIYLVGSTTDEGRRMQANSVLLWQAILHAKRSGCAWFDIGGLDEATPAGVAEFKRGVNAAPYRLSGEWRWLASLFSGKIK